MLVQQTIKFVNYTPESWKMDQMVQIMKMCSYAKESISNLKTICFQNNMVSEWNPKSLQVSKVIVPRVFLPHDEVTMDCYGNVW